VPARRRGAFLSDRCGSSDTLLAATSSGFPATAGAGDDSDAGDRDESEWVAPGDAVADRDLEVCDRSNSRHTRGRRAVEDRGGLQSGPDSSDERPGPDPASQRADCAAAAVLRSAGQPATARRSTAAGHVPAGRPPTARRSAATGEPAAAWCSAAATATAAAAAVPAASVDPRGPGNARSVRGAAEPVRLL